MQKGDGVIVTNEESVFHTKFGVVDEVLGCGCVLVTIDGVKGNYLFAADEVKVY